VYKDVIERFKPATQKHQNGIAQVLLWADNGETFRGWQVPLIVDAKSKYEKHEAPIFGATIPLQKETLRHQLSDGTVCHVTFE